MGDRLDVTRRSGANFAFDTNESDPFPIETAGHMGAPKHLKNQSPQALQRDTEVKTALERPSPSESWSHDQGTAIQG
jgi:hypothetical protein